MHVNNVNETEEVNEYAVSTAACGAARSSRAACAASAAGVSDGTPGLCAPVPQGPVVQKVNWASITLGIVGWALIGLTILVMWLAIEASASDPDPTGKEVYGFLPLFALMFIGPANLAGGIIGIVGASGKPKTRKLNWLGILLNASPYVVFAILMIVVIVAAAGTSHASMMIVGARPTMASL